MLLKRQEKDNKIKAIYTSSNICASIFDKDTKDLTLIFNHGGQYKYSKVTDTDYTRFELAESQGSVFNSHIKQYITEKLDKVDVTEILKEVNELKAADDKASESTKIKSMLDAMLKLTAAYVSTDKINPVLLSAVEVKVSEYNKSQEKSAPVVA